MVLECVLLAHVCACVVISVCVYSYVCINIDGWIEIKGVRGGSGASCLRHRGHCQLPRGQLPCLSPRVSPVTSARDSFPPIKWSRHHLLPRFSSPPGCCYPSLLPPQQLQNLFPSWSPPPTGIPLLLSHLFCLLPLLPSAFRPLRLRAITACPLSTCLSLLVLVLCAAACWPLQVPVGLSLFCASLCLLTRSWARNSREAVFPASSSSPCWQLGSSGGWAVSRAGLRLQGAGGQGDEGGMDLPGLPEPVGRGQKSWARNQ